MKASPITALLLLAATRLPAQSPFISGVDEYCPAPGQFINTMPAFEPGNDRTDMLRKCEERLTGGINNGVSLGAFGGYVTFHFDHPVVNAPGQMDFAVYGNAVDDMTEQHRPGGGAEPGIVMVMRDDNNNGLPDDTWYELAGEQTEGVNYGYRVTYTYDSDNQTATWTDNLGRTGSVPRNKYHKQDYWPQWIDSPLTLTGTLLPDNGVKQSDEPEFWLLSEYGHGYADNCPNTYEDYSHFDLSWAVNPLTRQPVELSEIHFVRVYTALQQVCGWIGETSTEVMGAEDLHPTLVNAVSTPAAAEGARRVTHIFTPDGREVSTRHAGGQPPVRGLYLIKYNDGTVRKTFNK